MHRPDIVDHMGKKGITNGLTHFAISVGSKEAVNKLAERFRADNFTIQG